MSTDSLNILEEKRTIDLSDLLSSLKSFSPQQLKRKCYKKLDLEKYEVHLNFLPRAVIDEKHNIQYWGIEAKIKPYRGQWIDKLYKKRTVKILISCNGRMSSNWFKAKLDDYGYSYHGGGQRKTAVIRENDLIQDPKVNITINFWRTCRCQTEHKEKGNYHPQCEVIAHQNKPKSPTTSRKRARMSSSHNITNFFAPQKKQRLNTHQTYNNHNKYRNNMQRMIINDPNEWKLSTTHYNKAIEEITKAIYDETKQHQYFKPNWDCFTSRDNKQDGCNFFITKEQDFFDQKYDSMDWKQESRICWIHPPHKPDILMRIVQKVKDRCITGYLCGPLFRGLSEMAAGSTDWERDLNTICRAKYVLRVDGSLDVFTQGNGKSIRMNCPYDMVVYFFDGAKMVKNNTQDFKIEKDEE